MDAKKKTFKEYIGVYWQQILLLIILLLWWLKCRIIPWWFWLIFIIILIVWSIQKNKKLELKKLLGIIKS
jgi:hypothetical protein